MLSRRARVGLVGALVVVATASALLVARGRRGGDGAAPPSAAEAEAATTREAAAVATDVQATWAELLRRGGRSYSEARVVGFRGAVRSECGWDERAASPFYCAADERLYLELDVAGALLARGDRAGRGAVAYVVAHALGHHVQALTGVDRRVRRDQRAEPAREEALGRALELQADCYVGVWARASATTLLDDEGVEPALAALAEVVERHPPAAPGSPPESWRHADLATRVAWVRRGLAAGDPDACDPFAAPSPP